jgi:hypothetical protein
MPRYEVPNRCDHRDRSGRRCRLTRAAGHPAFCTRHARKDAEGKVAPPNQLLADLQISNQDYDCAKFVNRLSSRILFGFLSNRISSRDAAVAGYLCQILVQTLPHLERDKKAAQAERPFIYVSSIPRPRYPGDDDPAMPNNMQPDASSEESSGRFHEAAR